MPDRVTYKFEAVCNDCEFKVADVFRGSGRYCVALGEGHLAAYPEHNVKILTIEITEVVVGEQFLR